MIEYSPGVQQIARQYRVPAKAIQQMVTDQVLDPAKLTNGSQKPSGLITIAEAMQRWDLPYTTIHTWVRRGRLKINRCSGHGPGGVILIDPTEVQGLIDNPPKEGRPPKTAQ